MPVSDGSSTAGSGGYTYGEHPVYTTDDEGRPVPEVHGEGEIWVETENPLGQMGYYVFSKGATGPFRVKIRSASFSNVSILPWLLRGVFVPDVITILGSLYFILGDIDR